MCAAGAGRATMFTPYTRAVRVNKQNPVFSMHGYHLGKKPHEALQKHIEALTVPGELVLDPFAGSGSTALAAVLSGRRAISVDASPAAVFIAKFYLRKPDPKGLAARWARLLVSVREEMEWLYGTTCHLCGGAARLHYVIHSNVYHDPRSGERVTMYEARAIGASGAVIGTDLPIVGYEPVAVCASCTACGAKRFERGLTGTTNERRAFETIDLPRIAEIEAAMIPHWYPQRFMMDVADAGTPWGDEWAPSRNVRTVAELFTKRNLWALSALWARAAGDDDLRAIITAGMLAVSRKAQHLDGGGGYIPGHWALPPMSKQRHVIDSLSAVARKAIAGKAALAGRFDAASADVREGDAADLSGVAESSVDYVLTDPPYGPLVQYAELNCLWEAWLGASPAWREREVIVSRTRGRDERDWAARLGASFKECRRVLKPERWLSVCYHDTSPKRCGVVADAIKDAGFVLHTKPGVIDSGGRSYVQHTSDKPTKRELVWHAQRSSRAVVSVPGTPAASAAVKIDAKAWLARAVREARSRTRVSDDVLYDAVIERAMREGVMSELKLTRAMFQRAAATSQRLPGSSGFQPLS